MVFDKLFKKTYDSEDKKCEFCGFIGKPIIETNKMGFGTLSPGPFFGRSGSSSAMKHKRYILICPKCKCIIGAK